MISRRLTSALLRPLALLDIFQPYNLPWISRAYLIPFLYLLYCFQWLQHEQSPVIQVRQVVRQIDSDRHKIRRLENVKELQVKRDGQVRHYALSPLIAGRVQVRSEQ
jgi:hypothetical protein